MKKIKNGHLADAIIVPSQIAFPSLWYVSKYQLSSGGLFCVYK